MFNLFIVSSICFEHPKCSASGRLEYAVLWFSFHAYMQAVCSLAGCAGYSIEHILPASSVRSVGSYYIDKYNEIRVALRPNTGRGLLMLDVCRSHKTTRHSR